jgi:hypothetical protein
LVVLEKVEFCLRQIAPEVPSDVRLLQRDLHRSGDEQEDLAGLGREWDLYERESSLTAYGNLEFNFCNFCQPTNNEAFENASALRAFLTPC